MAKWLMVFLMAATAATAETPKVEIPAGAVQGRDGAYRYTDGLTGKKWIYRRTPFGVARVEDKPVAARPPEVPPGMTATEDGEAIRFERPSPFGTYRWQRKKTELNEMEQAAWDREKARAAQQD